MNLETNVASPVSAAAHDVLHVVVFAPRAPNPKTFAWQAILTIGDAARQAATDFGYTGGNPGLQTEGRQPRVLDNNKTLAAEQIHNGDKLELIDTGGGV
jgi:hypothetical protein